MREKHDKIKTGRIARFLEMSKLSTMVSANYILPPLSFNKSWSEVFKERNKSSAKMIVETLGRLKGPILKVGQLISTYDEFLPEEFAEAFSTLQDDVAIMEYSVIRKQIKKELGKEPEDIFKSFEKDAFAAASLGQVHRAWLKDGTKVAVKIQYPGIDEALESDMKMLKMWMTIGENAPIKKVVGTGLNLMAIYNEIKNQVELELDYTLEAKNLKKFQEIFKDDKDILIPKVYDEYSTKRVLTMEYMEGRKLKSVLQEKNLPVEVREKIGENLVNMFLKQTLKNKVVHGDPHPGNYLINDDNKLILLDYGCVKYLPDYFHEGLYSLYRGLYNNDKKEVLDACLKLKFIHDEKDYNKFWDHYDGMDFGHDVKKKYTFSDFAWGLLVSSLIVIRKGEVDTNLIIYMRALEGLYSYFYLIDAEINPRRILAKYI